MCTSGEQHYDMHAVRGNVCGFAYIVIFVCFFVDFFALVVSLGVHQARNSTGRYDFLYPKTSLHHIVSAPAPRPSPSRDPFSPAPPTLCGRHQHREILIVRQHLGT